MSSTVAGDDLVAENTTGYKVSDKKTLDELQKLDENDGIFINLVSSYFWKSEARKWNAESLKKWKESLGLSSQAAKSGTPKFKLFDWIIYPRDHSKNLHGI
jgi:hypothetical protein